MKERNSIRIVPLGPRDILDLEALENVTGLSPWGREHYVRFLESPSYFGLKAVGEEGRGKQFIGFSFSRAVLEDLEILKIGVWPEYQGRGIGTRLMEATYVEGIRRDCRRCFLEVRKSNETALRFYHTHKFRIIGERINYYTDPVEDAWVMERWL